MSSEENIFRSAEMSLIQIHMASEISRDAILALGELGNIHFIDRNKDVSAFQRQFVKEIRRLDNVERQLRYLESLISNQHSLEIVHDPFLILKNESISDIEKLVTDVEILEKRVLQLETSYEDLKKRQFTLLEQRYVLNGSRVFFENEVQQQARISIDQIDDAPLLLQQESLEAGLQLSNLNDLAMNYVVGSIPRAKIEILNKILWRTLRGNLYFNHQPINEPILDLVGNGTEKDVFIVFTHGQLLLQKVKKIIDSLDGRVFDTSADDDVYQQSLGQINDQITDLDHVLESTHQQLHTELFVIADQIESWQAIIKREKKVYSTLNLCSQRYQGLIADGWCPTSELDITKNVLRDIEGSTPPVLSLIKTNISPPTYHRTNKFTDAFQNIVDAYGIASYREVNPGLATIVTFPFMFAIMFGDLGHGFIVFLVALTLVLNEKKLKLQKKDEIFDMAFSGRYILLLMGIFSMYTGLLYNDIFSRSMSLFKSGWEYPKEFQQGETIEAVKVGVYPIGLDWIWHGTENNLIFTNSYKMKLSILMGFTHMLYSLTFSLVNYRYKHSKLDIFGNFLPGLAFMLSIFGYLAWSIVYKWCVDWIGEGRAAPGLLNMLISMVLSPGTVEVELYTGQAYLQVFLLLIAGVSVPILLLLKPLRLRYLNNRAIQRGYSGIHEEVHDNMVQDAEVQDSEDEDENNNEMNVTYMLEPEEFEFGDIMIHQVIHTIEFCLNCVSHTASYLRLWALSLAHAQLSSVLWSMTISNAFSSEKPGSPLQVAKVVILFGMWFVLTVCILVLMEGTSAMLHSLRLHWVEAMSKFFEGEGYAYDPFNFKDVNDHETA